MSISSDICFTAVLPETKTTFFLVTGSMKGETAFQSTQKMAGDSYIHNAPSLQQFCPKFLFACLAVSLHQDQMYEGYSQRD